MTHQFEMIGESSSDEEQVLSKILKKLGEAMEIDYKMKEMKSVRFFLLPWLDHVYEDTFVR